MSNREMAVQRRVNRALSLPVNRDTNRQSQQPINPNFWVRIY